jgi:hypothetical protein
MWLGNAKTVAQATTMFAEEGPGSYFVFAQKDMKKSRCSAFSS